MPVRFEQQAPMAPGFTAGAGAAQQYSRDLPSLVSLYESLSRGGHGGGGGGGYHNPFPGGVGGNRSSPIGGGPHGTGGGGYSGSNGPLNQAETLRMQRLQAADAAVDADDSLSPKEKYRYKLQIHAGLDPLMEKQKQAKAEMMQEQTNQLMQQHAQMSAMQSESEAARAQAFSKKFVRNPDTGQVIGFMDHKGDLKPLPAWELQGRKEAENAKREDAERKQRMAEFHQDQQLALKMLPKEKDDQGNETTPDPDKVNELAEHIRRNRERREENHNYWKGQGEGAVPGNAEQSPAGQATGAAPVATGGVQVPNPFREKVHKAGQQLLQDAQSRLEQPQAEADEPEAEQPASA